MKKVLIYGRGQDAIALVNIIKDMGMSYTDSVVAFTDKNASDNDDLFMGYTVICPERINDHKDVTLIISSRSYEKEIKEDIITKYGYCGDQIMTYDEYARYIHISCQHNSFAGKESLLPEPYGRLAVYTSVQHGYDKVLDPQVVEKGVSYICFTEDTSIKSDVWEIRPFEEKDEWSHRKVKILPHRYLNEFDTSLWVDANYRITDRITDYIKEYDEGHGMLVFPHPERHCLYDEAAAVTLFKKASKTAVAREIGCYANKNMPPNFGLLYGGIIFRRHKKPEIISFMERWWELFQQFSHRDQISLPYLLWETGLPIDVCEEYIYGNRWFEKHEHLV